MPMPLAVIEHRGLVFLPLADDDDAVHVHGVEEEPHGVDGRLVGGVLVAPAHPARRRQRGGLGGADQIEQARLESRRRGPTPGVEAGGVSGRGPRTT